MSVQLATQQSRVFVAMVTEDGQTRPVQGVTQGSAADLLQEISRQLSGSEASNLKVEVMVR